MDTYYVLGFLWWLCGFIGWVLDVYMTYRINKNFEVKCTYKELLINVLLICCGPLMLIFVLCFHEVTLKLYDYLKKEK